MTRRFELLQDVQAVELARRRFPARVLLARRTPEHVSGAEVSGLDIVILHGLPLWLPGFRWKDLAQCLDFRDLDVPDPSGDGVCQTRQVIKTGSAYIFRRWITNCHIIHPHGVELAVPRVGQRLVLDASFCRVYAGETAITKGPDRLNGRDCPHLWLH